MSHTVKVVMVADQEIYINNKPVNIHDIGVIYVDDSGVITEVALIENLEEQMSIEQAKTVGWVGADEIRTRCKKCGYATGWRKNTSWNQFITRLIFDWHVLLHILFT